MMRRTGLVHGSGGGGVCATQTTRAELRPCERLRRRKNCRRPRPAGQGTPVEPTLSSSDTSVAGKQERRRVRWPARCSGYSRGNELTPAQVVLREVSDVDPRGRHYTSRAPP